MRLWAFAAFIVLALFSTNAQAREKFLVWNFAPGSGGKDYKTTAEYRALAKQGDVIVLDINSKPGERLEVGLKKQLKALCQNDPSICKADVMLTGHSSGESFWGDKNNNRLNVVDAKKMIDELAAEGVRYEPKRVFIVGCYSGAVGYLAFGRAQNSGEEGSPPSFVSWSDVFKGQPTYFAFGLKGPDRNDPIFGRYLDKMLSLSKEVREAAEKSLSQKKAPVVVGTESLGCDSIRPLEKAEILALQADPLSALLAKFEFIAPRNPTICVTFPDKKVFADQSGTVLLNESREDERCNGYFRRMWCSEEVKNLSRTYGCYHEPAKDGCASSKYNYPPPEDDKNDIRKFYNFLQSAIHCEKTFERVKMEKFPIPFHVLGLIKFRGVVDGYMKQLKEDPERQDLYQTLQRDNLPKMSRRELVAYLTEKIKTEPKFQGAYYTLVTFNQVQEKWFN